MKFSVIIPIYNCEDSLLRCIESILNQTYPDWELILVDDGSTDGSFSLCEAYSKKDGRILVIHQENAGQGSARNNGMQTATGDYIVFCDADDFYEENALEIFVNTAEREKMPDLIIGGYREFRLTDDNSTTSMNENKPLHFYVNAFDDIRDAYLPLKRQGLLNAPWGKAYKTKVIVDNHVVFPDYSRCQDVFFNIDFYKNLRTIVVVESVLYNFNVHDKEKQTKKFPSNMFEIHKAVSLKVYNTVAEWNRLDREAEKYLNQCYINGLFVLLRVNYQNQWKRNKIKCRELSQKMLNDELTIRSCRTVPYGTTNKIIRLVVKSRSVTLVNLLAAVTIIYQKMRG